jgi:hypothetical protein
MDITVDIRRWSWEIAEYVALHLHHICSESEHDTEDSFFNPTQTLVFNELVGCLFLPGDVECHTNDTVTAIYMALYPKFPDIGIFELTTMVEEVVTSERFVGLSSAVDRALSSIDCGRHQVVDYHVRNRLSTLKLKVEPWS